jgi:hypothetical protein
MGWFGPGNRCNCCKPCACEGGKKFIVSPAGPVLKIAVSGWPSSVSFASVFAGFDFLGRGSYLSLDVGGVDQINGTFMFPINIIRKTCILISQQWNFQRELDPVFSNGRRYNEIAPSPQDCSLDSTYDPIQPITENEKGVIRVGGMGSGGWSVFGSMSIVFGPIEVDNVSFDLNCGNEFEDSGTINEIRLRSPAHTGCETTSPPVPVSVSLSAKLLNVTVV